MSKATPTELEHLLSQYQQWLNNYAQSSPKEQERAKEKYQTIQTLVTQLQEIPNADCLQDPVLITAAQDFWKAVRFAQALLTEDRRQIK